jgi:hypothetical protein
MNRDYFAPKIFVVLLLSVCGAIILLWTVNKFGNVPSLIGLVMFVTSTGINIFSESLYWSIWLFLLPLAIVCLIETVSPTRNLLLFLFTLPAFLLKFLSGWEFITIVVFTALTPYAWDFFVNKNSAALRSAIFVIASSAIAFILSLLFYLNCFSQENNSNGIHHVFSRLGFWSAMNLRDLPIVPWKDVVKSLCLNFIDFNGYGLPLIFVLCFMLCILFWIRRRLVVGDMKFIIFLLLGSVSWHVAMPGHIFFHLRYAPLVFFLPFGLFAPSFIATLFFRNKRSSE